MEAPPLEKKMTLYQEIEEMRLQLIELVLERNSFVNDRVVAYSQSLDDKLAEWQELMARA